MKCGFLLDVVVTKSAAVFKLFTSKNQPLLIWGDSFFILDFCFHVLNSIAGLNFQCDCLSCESLDKDLHTTTKTKDQMECGFFLNVVVTQGAAVLKLFSSEDQPLLIWRDSFLILKKINEFHKKITIKQFSRLILKSECNWLIFSTNFNEFHT